MTASTCQAWYVSVQFSPACNMSGVLPMKDEKQKQYEASLKDMFEKRKGNAVVHQFSPNYCVLPAFLTTCVGCSGLSWLILEP